MEKKEQLLIIDPPTELMFRGPFTKSVVTSMSLTNPSDRTLLFKIKTTAPRKYCVRPNFGHVNPNSSTKVEICLQAFVFDPNEKNKHKFMVQSFIVPDGTPDSEYSQLWKKVDTSELMDSKLKCVFVLPTELQTVDDCAQEVVTQETKPKTLEEFKPTIDSSELGELKEEKCKLKQENLKLKEQILRLTPETQRVYSPPVEQQIPMFYIALSIATAILGLLLGKYLL